ncbi:MAG TPA: enoyl-CoA hydratase-related protein [Vicinamibacteria bacterium]|nr:enoyl-CoA hydratase-related protein [Vicinamibacteria bacterium]
MSVRYELHDYVARVTIERPEVLNAIDSATERMLQEIWREIEDEPEARVVVLTGAGEKAFSVGADMKSTSSDEPASGLEYWARPRPGGFGGIALRTTLDVPVVARVNGYALGGGFEMVLGCDIVVACDEAQFGFPEPRVGRMPLDGGMVLLSRQVPEKWALGMLLTGKRIDAAEAFRVGLVNEVVPRPELDSAVDRWIADILACAPLSVRAIKQSVRRTSALSPADAQSMRLPAVVAALRSEDAKEGVRAFREKRPPRWRGR